MAVKVFIYTLFFIAFGATLYNYTQPIKKAKPRNSALVTFENALVYTIDQKQVKEILEAKKILKFRKKEELYNGVLITRDKKHNYTDIISANKIVRNYPKLYLSGNVIFTRDDIYNLETQNLVYDFKNQIVKAKGDFVSKIQGHSFSGKELYVDLNKIFIKAKSVHFEIEEKGK